MGNEFEVFRDAEGNNHLIFDQSALYDDSQIGNKMSDFEVLRIIGSFDNKNPISKVRCLKNNKIYAMKMIDLKEINEEERKLCLEQMEKLKSLNHPHLLKYYKTFIDENQILYLIYEYMNNSDLNSLIKAHNILNKDVKEETIWNILLQCLSGISYLHKENLASLAIKPTNIYLNNEQNTKISLFYTLPKLNDKNYDIHNDIYFIGKYFYNMCFPGIIAGKKNAWIDDIVIVKQPTKYSNELMNIIYMMAENAPEKKSSLELYNIAKSEYVKKFSKITSIDAVLRCLYSFKIFNNSIQQQKDFIVSNKEKCYISYWFWRSINAIGNNEDPKECYEEFRRALASTNSKIDCSKEVEPVFLFAFLLEKMHKEMNIKRTTSVLNQNANQQYVINSIYRIEEKYDKSNKTEMWNKFKSYMDDNINSVISNLFYGVKKVKRVCSQCKNAVYSFNNFFCSAFDLTKVQNNNYFDLEKSVDRIQKNNKTVCEVCLTEQEYNDFDDYYIMPKHLVFCFYRGINFVNYTKINFNPLLTVIENKGSGEEIEKVKVQFELIGSVNRIINNKNEEEFVYYCRNLNNINIWHYTYGYSNGVPLQNMQQNGQVIMLFYNKIN